MPLHVALDAKQLSTRPKRVYGNDYKVGKYISSPKESGAASLRVTPCGNHDNPVVVPVEVGVWNNDRKEMDVLGKAKACPICWELLGFISGKEVLKKLFAETA